MITEDYVSFETAKLLKEKGFDVLCRQFYSCDRDTAEILFGIGNFNWNKKNTITSCYDSACSAPTLQIAMKWLREVHNLHIEVYRTACGYLYIISKVPTGSDIYDNGCAYDGDDEDSGQWTTYEKACEAAIKYCLENLI